MTVTLDKELTQWNIISTIFPFTSQLILKNIETMLNLELDPPGWKAGGVLLVGHTCATLGMNTVIHVNL